MKIIQKAIIQNTNIKGKICWNKSSGLKKSDRSGLAQTQIKYYDEFLHTINKEINYRKCSTDRRGSKWFPVALKLSQQLPSMFIDQGCKKCIKNTS